MKRILIAEDNEINRLLLVSIIDSIRLDIEIIEANDGLETVEKFIRYKPDMIFMDVRMPGMSGLDATTKIRLIENGERAVIIGLTASAQETDKEKCLKSGMNDFIAKPIKRNAIKAVLDRWIPEGTNRL